MHTFSFILGPYSFHLSEKMSVDWHRISIIYKKLMRLKAYYQWLKRPWKKCALYTYAYGTQKTTSAEEKKFRQKIFFCVIFIHFHLFWDHVVFTLSNLYLKNVS